MGKFTKDKRVRKTHQYSNNVLHFFYSNLGYLLPKSQVVMLSGSISLQTSTNRRNIQDI